MSERERDGMSEQEDKVVFSSVHLTSFPFLQGMQPIAQPSTLLPITLKCTLTCNVSQSVLHTCRERERRGGGERDTEVVYFVTVSMTAVAGVLSHKKTAPK